MKDNYTAFLSGLRPWRTKSDNSLSPPAGKAVFKDRSVLLTALLFIVSVVPAMAQSVAQYTFSQTVGSYTPITGGTAQIGTSAAPIDDNVYSALPIGFTFFYNGTNYTDFGINANGWIGLGATAVTSSPSPISGGSSNNVISAFGVDLVAKQYVTVNRTIGSAVLTVTAGATANLAVGSVLTGTGIPAGATILSVTATTITISANATATATAAQCSVFTPTNGIRYQTIGTAPNRSLVVQFSEFSRFLVSGDYLNFQIILHETTNTIDVVYNVAASTATTSSAVQVGLRGTGSTVYNNRTATTTWNPTTAGTSSSSTVAYSNTVLPASGLTYTWTVPTTPGVSGTTLTAFSNTCPNTTNATTNSFTVSGYNLTDSVVINPLTGFTFSTTSEGTYTPSLTLAPVSGSISQVVYVKFSPTAVQSYSGNISITSSGASATVAAVGAGVSITPTTVAGAASAILPTSATLAGTISTIGCTTVTAYGIEYSTTSGFAGGTGTQVAGTGFSGTAGGTFTAPLSGLTSGTIYYFRSYATNSGGTSYSSIGSFTTQSITTVTWTEGFATTTLPTGWTNNSTSTWFVGATGGGNPGNAIYKEIYSASTGGNSFSTINVGPLGANDKLTFSYKLTNYSSSTTAPASGSGNFVVAVSTDFGSTWTNLETVNNNGVTGWQSKAYALSAYAGQTVKIRITGNWVSGDFYQAFDNFTIFPAPSCDVPSSLVAQSTPQGTGATLSWTAPGIAPGNGYEYEVRTSGAAGSGTTGVALSGTSATASAAITGLTANTSYTVYVRSNCGSGTYSSWTTGVTFYTGYCTPTGTNTSYWITNVKTTGGSTNLDNTTVASTGGYSNYSASASFSQYATGSVNFSIATNASTHYFYIWIDYNNDLDFLDAGEAILNTSSSSYAGSYSGSYTIPAGTPMGSYRVRVANSYSGSITSCGTTTGEYEDYTLNVIAAPSCFVPVGTFTSSAITTTGATINWNAPATAPSNGYEYYYTTTTDNPNTTNPAALGSSTATNAIITGLTTATTYNWWVRSVCGTSDRTAWVSGGSFTTFKLEPTEYVTNFAVSTSTTAAVNFTWTVPATGVLPDGYLLKGKTTATITDPADATDPANADLATADPSRKVTGTATATGQLAGGTAGTMYYFKNYTYTNSGTGINFKTDGTAPSLNYATKPTATATPVIAYATPTTGSVTWVLPATYDAARHTVLVFVKPTATLTTGTATVNPSTYVANTVVGAGTAYQNDALATNVYSGDGTTVNITGLTQNTAYYVSVVIVMEASNFDATYSYSAFATGSATTQAVTPVTWTEGFATTAVPAGWVNPSAWTIGGASTQIGAGTTNYIYKNIFSATTTGANFTILNVGPVTADNRLVFDYKLANWASPYSAPPVGSGNFVVDISTDYGTTWTTLATVDNNAVNGWQTKFYSLATYVGQTVKLRFTANWVAAIAADYVLAFDNFKIEPVPTCEAPVFPFAVSGITNATATISWSASSSAPAGGYEYYYAASNVAPTASTVALGATEAGVLTANITGLTGSTTYYWWTRAVCDSSNKSSWTAGGNFTTSCDQVAAFTQNFDAATTFPSCWYKVGTIGTAYPMASFASSAPNALYMYASSATIRAVVSMPPVSNINSNTNWLKFKYRAAYTVGETLQVGYLTNATDASTFVVVASVPVTSLTYAETAVDFGTIPPANSVLAFRTAGVVANGISIDDVAWETKPACVQPTNGFSASAISFTGATLNWTASSSAPANGYEYYYSTSNTAPIAATVASGTTAAGVVNAPVTGLAANTTYYWWVRSVCDATTSSAWANGGNFYTGYCVPSSTSTYYDIESVSTTGGLTNINNVTNDISAGGYGSFTAQSVTHYPGATVNFNIGLYIDDEEYDAYGVNVWVDWNDDFIFSTSEKVYGSGVYVQSASGSFTVPLTAAVGNHRMRVRADYNSANPSACGAISYGEAEDYTFTVVPVPTCYMPAGLTVSYPTNTTANFSWNAPAQGTAPAGYEYVVSTSSTAPAGNGTTTATPSVTGYSIALNTTYYLFVRTNCGNGDFSAWASTTVYSGYCLPTSTNTSDYISNFTTTGGITNISHASTAIAGTGYGNFSATYSVKQIAGSAINFSETYVGGSHGFNIWVDWNNNLVFEASEKVYASGTTNSSGFSGSFTIPASVAGGNYRIRIRAWYAGANPDPCSLQSYGEAKDYTLTVVPANCYDWTGAVSTAWATPGNWCGGTVPTATSNVTIAVTANQPVISTGTAFANNLTVAPGASLTVNTGATLSVAATLTTTGGTLTVQDNAALLQGSAVTANTNVGSITAVKNSNSLYRLDYTMWSSPVSGQTLGGFSSLTSTGRFYEYGVAAGAEHYIVVPETTVFEAAKGYLVRMPNTDPATGYSVGTTAVAFVGNFTGTPNNGTVTRAASVIADRYTAVGNPYPSPISVTDFFSQNSNVIDGGSALYFWRKKNNSAISSYASLNLTGFTSNEASAGNTGGQNNASFFSGVNTGWLIAQGQGFLVRTQVAPTGTNITFTNSMRRAAPTSGTQSFFRTGADTMSRFWINMTDSENGFSQAMVAYSDATTPGLDYGYDGELHTDGGRVSLYSLAANKNLSIQARPAFVPVDVVPMGFTANNAGQFTIALDRMDGLFEQGQVIYLKDNLLGITRSLATSSYSFASEAGTFNDRFEIVYATSALGTDTPTLDANTVMVYKEGSSIKINSGTAEMTGVKIFDIRGRQLYSKDGINATQTAVNGLQVAQEVLIVEIATVKGKVSKRIVF